MISCLEYSKNFEFAFYDIYATDFLFWKWFYVFAHDNVTMILPTCHISRAKMTEEELLELFPEGKDSFYLLIVDSCE